MRLTLLERESGLAVNKLFPLMTTLLFAVVSVVPLHIPGFAVVTPAFALMAVFHWTIYRSDLLPPLAVFVAGLLVDFLNGTPYVGTSALTLLLVRQGLLLLRQVFADRLFPVLWSGFLLTATLVTTFEWALISALHGGMLSTRPFIFEAVLTVASFPVGSYILAQIQRAFLSRV